MPEITERKLICDHPDNDGREGRLFHIQDGRLRRKVILCPEHARGLESVMSWGSADDTPIPLTGRRPRGLNPDRLRGLIVDGE